MNKQKQWKQNPKRDYPSDVSDEEWALVAPYLTLMEEEAPQREYPGLQCPAMNRPRRRSVAHDAQ